MDNSLLTKFQGSDGKETLIEALMAQPLVEDEDLAARVATRCRLEEVPRGESIICVGDEENNFFFILDGEFDVVIGSRIVEKRGAGEHVGELAMADPFAHRSATVVAAQDSLVARLTEAEFSAIATVCPRLWRRLALQLAKVVRAEDEALRSGATHLAA